MKKRVLLIILIVLLNVGCAKKQEVIPLDNPETRIYVTFAEKSENNKVEDINEFNEKELKEFYAEYAGYEIKQAKLSKVIVRNDPDCAIIHFNPLVSGIDLNNSFVVQLHDGYITSISTNPTKFEIPKEFETNKVLSLAKREKIKENLEKSYSIKGKIDEIIDKLYFDCHKYGRLIYTVKVSVDTEDYSFAKIYIFDAYSGKLLNRS